MKKTRERNKKQEGDFNTRFEKSQGGSVPGMSVWLKLLLQLFGLFLTTLNLDKEQRPSIPLQASPLWECFWVCEKEIASSLARMKCVEGGRLKPVRLERNCGLNWNLLF